MSDIKTKTFWITKYATTKGIYKIEDCEVYNDVYALQRRGQLCRIGTDAFETEEAAKANAHDKVLAGLKALEKKQQKLLKLLKVYGKDA